MINKKRLKVLEKLNLCTLTELEAKGRDDLRK